MPDDKMNSALNNTAGKMDEVSDQLDDQRRRTLNIRAKQRNIIDDGEDLFNDYRTTTVNALRGTQSFFDSDLDPKAKDVKAVLDTIEDDIGSDSFFSRRGFLAAIGVVGASGAGGGFYAASQLFGPSATSFAVADAPEFEDFYQGLRESQKRGIGLVYGDEEELFGDTGRDLVAFEARDNGGDSTEPEYKAWVKFPGGEIDDYDWQGWNNDDYRQFAERVGTVGEEGRIGDEGYINSILEGEIK